MPEKFHVYLKQPDRRMYPCVVLRDEHGLVAVHVALRGQAVSQVTEQELSVLKSFRGAESMRAKPVKPGKVVRGKWVAQKPSQFSYMMSRPDLQPVRVNWALRWERSQAQLDAMEREQKQLRLFDPHALSGLKYNRPWSS
jgi:hypothetical protein